ncbi:auxin efflux carrier transmembrane protein [Mycena belliarum]|uniref:Auxin efflux carrier transmembrane protein n=1 Tax=Mycena belliarum TaxID=1033014 RepID=A0AAD6TPH9_9AGAR|nr:auxin efflux carrier transmembrane protein [Mycena belliae]
MVSAGGLIWIACRPLFRLIICTGCGFFLTKRDLFPAIAAQGTSQILLNITYPSLMFSKIVPSFTAQNIGSLGPIVLVALIYQTLGMFFAWIVTQFFWVPHRFRWGILVAGGWANVGDIPTAVVLSIMGAAPFSGAADQTLSVGYISGFIFVSMITFFPLGGNRLVTRDYDGPDVEPDDVKAALRERQKHLFHFPSRAVRSLTRRNSPIAAAPIEKSPVVIEESREAKDAEEEETISKPRPVLSSRHVSFYEGEDHVTDARPSGAHSHGWNSRLTSPAPTATAIDTEPEPEHAGDPNTPPILPINTSPSAPSRFSSTLRSFLQNLLLPPSASILLSFVIALVPPLRALFIDVPGGTHIHPAPDGQPPLAFVMDTANFIGAASVPMGLVCLGSALARLRLPRGVRAQLPVGAILALSMGKMLLFPVVGVLLCKGLVHAGVISRTDKVLQFVCMFFSCLPTATTQVFVTQVASGTGSAEHLSAFLMPQYAFMLVSMTALTAYALQDLF